MRMVSFLRVVFEKRSLLLCPTWKPHVKLASTQLTSHLGWLSDKTACVMRRKQSHRYCHVAGKQAAHKATVEFF